MLPLDRAKSNLVKFVFREENDVQKRFTDEQIIGFLKQADGGVCQSGNCAGRMALAMPRSIPSAQSLGE